jgi:hypothetical protein
MILMTFTQHTETTSQWVGRSELEEGDSDDESPFMLENGRRNQRCGKTILYTAFTQGLHSMMQVTLLSDSR